MTDQEAIALAKKVVDRALDLMCEREVDSFFLEEMEDLFRLQRRMTPAAARQIVDGLDLEEGMPDEDVEPEDYARDILSQVGRDAGIILQTQLGSWEERELEEIAFNEQKALMSSQPQAQR